LHLAGLNGIEVDERWVMLANQIVKGIGVAAGSKVSVFITDASVTDAVSEFVSQCYKLGAIPQVLAVDEKFDRAAVAFASDEMLSHPPPLELLAMKWSDAHVSFRAMVTPDEGALDERRTAIQKKGKGAIASARWAETRWCLIRIPSREWAGMVGVSYELLLDEFFAGCLMEWSEVERKQDALCKMLDEVDSIRVVTPDTDLRLGVAGRRWISFSGQANLPDGEIATAPMDNEVNGHITFEEAFWFSGVKISGLRLQFVSGKVVEHSASQGEEFVSHVLGTDLGSRFVGELGIGLNSKIRSLTGDLLIDEKALGTVHIALGRSYPECLGVNESSIHWDLVKDLRKKGSYLYADKKILIKDGELSRDLRVFQT
jgi:aminopeptidase